MDQPNSQNDCFKESLSMDVESLYIDLSVAERESAGSTAESAAYRAAPAGLEISEARAG
jgi:hypothetical protein